MLNVSNIVEGFRAVFRPRPGGLRVHVLLLIFCFEMERFTNVGAHGSFYLYLRRQLEFRLEDLALYNTVSGIHQVCLLSSQELNVSIWQDILRLASDCLVGKSTLA